LIMHVISELLAPNLGNWLPELTAKRGLDLKRSIE
jgi:hypothetical protein